MSAVFNKPENGDLSLANETKTSDKPEFDLRTLFSEVNDKRQSRTNSAIESAAYELDFSQNDNIYSQTSRTGNDGAFNFEQRGAMEIASRFASFDDDTNDNTIHANFDREDAGRLMEVYGDMYHVQNSINEGDKSDANQWLGELRRDLASFARGVFDDPSRNGDCLNGSGEENGSESEPQHGGEHWSEESSEYGSEYSSESDAEGHSENCENNIEYT